MRVPFLSFSQPNDIPAIHRQPGRLTASRPHSSAVVGAVIGMIAGAVLKEHSNPGEATVQIAGRVRLSTGDLSWEGRTGDLLIVPDARHSLEALVDSAVLLTVAKLS